MKINHNYELLKSICLSPISDFEKFGQVWDTQDGIFIYKENPKAKILAVAHLDSVLDLDHFYRMSVGGRDIVVNAQLDDRLGVYTLLHVLPQFGIEFDLLLTEGEETGRSTAAYFESTKRYNWMFSFDRHGDDVVFYQYDDKGIREDAKQAGLRYAHGSFSDIAFLGHLKVRGMNIGVGYYDEHFELCYADMEKYDKQVNRFATFYKLFEDKRYDYTYVKTKKKIVSYGGTSTSSNFDGYNDRFLGQDDSWKDVPFKDDGWKDIPNNDCTLCIKGEGTNAISDDVFLCDACFSHAEQCVRCNDITYAELIEDGICYACIEQMTRESGIEEDRSY